VPGYLLKAVSSIVEEAAFCFPCFYDRSNKASVGCVIVTP
jgi:hypothetical protein